MLADEKPPEGIAKEVLAALEQGSFPEEAPAGGPESDLYSMWSAVTALTQEVRLQGRSFKELSETLGPMKSLSGFLSEIFKEHAEVVVTARDFTRNVVRMCSDVEQDTARRVERSTRREMIEVLLDLRDRLKRGLHSVQASAQAARKDLGSGLIGLLLSLRDRAHPLLETTQALEKGYVLTLEHLDGVLSDNGVREIECEGMRFDARTMSAVDLEETDRVPQGTVLEVYRPGYRWESEVLRPAEVKVARGFSEGGSHGR
jgi:molecular chaperone GrpE